MAGFKFGKTIKTYDIYNEDDSIFRTYSFDIGNEDDYKALMEGYDKIKKLDEKDVSSKIIDEQLKISKGIINRLLNNDFDEIYKKANKNFNWIVLLLQDLIQFYMKESPKGDKFSRYK